MFCKYGQLVFLGVWSMVQVMLTLNQPILCPSLCEICTDCKLINTQT